LLCVAHAAQAAIPVYGFTVKNAYPHDPRAFTQGLFYKDGFLYESTGRNGQSSLRKVDLTTGKVLQRRDLAADFFGEGIAEVGGEILCLTWTTHVGFVFDRKTFDEKRRFSFTGEGWGLASDGAQVYMSDGTADIRVLNRETLDELSRIHVTVNGTPVARLNELEWVDGELFANVWGEDLIARIDPSTGHVVGWIDLTGLLKPGQRGTTSADAVLNGIAYDGKRNRLFVTGKLWPKLFEIQIVEDQNAVPAP
jgi:glutaminyl-peptide cyclotransferase